MKCTSEEEQNLTPAHGPPEVNEGDVANVESKAKEENVEEMAEEEIENQVK
jgi:hypothetical protein